MATTKELENKRRPTVLPVCSIQEEDGKVVLFLELPGVEKGDVSISVENDELKIHGKRNIPVRESKYLFRERRQADFYSSFTLDDTIDRDRIEAETSQGTLTVTLHLKESGKPKQISVREVK